MKSTCDSIPTSPDGCCWNMGTVTGHCSWPQDNHPLLLLLVIHYFLSGFRHSHRPCWCGRCWSTPRTRRARWPSASRWPPASSSRSWYDPGRWRSCGPSTIARRRASAGPPWPSPSTRSSIYAARKKSAWARYFEKKPFEGRPKLNVFHGGAASVWMEMGLTVVSSPFRIAKIPH